MGDLPRLSDREIDSLFAGKIPDEPALDDLTDLVREVRGAYVSPPTKAVESRQLAAMAEVARVAGDQDISIRSQSEKTRRWSRARAIKEALMPRIRTAALAVKLAALTLVAAIATGGLAAAGVISLPNPLPDQASDRADAVHKEIDGSDPSAERCAFGLSVAEAASDGNGNLPSSADACESENGTGEAAAQEGRGKSDAARNGDVGTQQHEGAQPEEGAGEAFGDSVSDRAGGGEAESQGGEEFGDSVSDDAQQLVPRPSPQTTPEGGRETGESFSEQGQETGETQSQGGQETGDNASGGRVPDR